MPRPKYFDIDPVAAVTNDICLSQTKASSGALTLDGAKAGTTLDFARQISIYSSANIAARVFTVVGTDANGRSITDTVTGINNGTVSTTKYFKTVTSISVDASFSPNTIIAGTSAAIATAISPLDHYCTVPAQVTVELVSGTATFSVQETYSPLDSTADEVWITPSALNAKNATLTAPLDQSAKGCRLVTSAISSPNINFIIHQANGK